MLLAVCMLVGLLPVITSGTQVEAESVSGTDSLTCAGFIFNAISRKYIDTMMKDHLNTNSTLRSTLDNGKSLVFMFEGGSDNYPSNAYEDAAYDSRNQAYFVGVYQSGDLTCTTGVRVYSLGSYCKTVAAKESSVMKDLAAATAVYGYYCKQYFTSL
jgi:hypothetical protein